MSNNRFAHVVSLLALSASTLGCSRPSTGADPADAQGDAGEFPSDWHRNVIVVIVFGTEEAFDKFEITVEGATMSEPVRSPRSAEWSSEVLWRSWVEFCVADRDAFLTRPLDVVALGTDGTRVESTIERLGCLYSDNALGNLEEDTVILQEDGRIDARFDENPMTLSDCGETDPYECGEGENRLESEE